MPSASGVYSLPPGYLAATGTTIQVSQHNPIFEDVAAALTARLSRDGTAPMTGALQLAAGTVTAPGAVFSTDPSSGFYKTTNGIGVSIQGTQVAEFTAAGLASGARLIGEMIPFTGSNAPSALWVRPWGQTLSRTAQPALWAFAQNEIAIGNTLYNNGDGSTTFGIPDMRGRVPAGWDISGTGRLVNFLNSTVLGAAGGIEGVTLTNAQIPQISSAGVNSITVAPQSGGATIPVTPGNIFLSGSGTGGNNSPASTIGTWAGVTQLSGNNNISVLSNNTGGQSHNNLQPTLIVNYLLFAGD